MNDNRAQYEGHDDGELEDREDLVRCFFSGMMIPKREAVLVRVGPGRRVWMKEEFCRDG